MNSDDGPDRLQQATWAGTAVFSLSSIVAVFSDAVPVVVVSVAVSIVLFALGLVAFALGFVRAAGRSRTEVLDLPGLFFLSGSAPKPVQRSMMWAMAVQTIVAFVTPIVQPVRELAFGLFVPVFGLGMATLWAARHGTFADRPEPATKQTPTSSADSSTLGSVRSGPRRRQKGHG